MNDDKLIEVDASKLNKMLDRLNLNNKETKLAFKRGFRKSAQVIRKQAQENLKTVKNKGGDTLNYRNLLQFVNMTIYRSGTGARVDVMDNKKKSTNVRLAKKGMANKSFTLKFFAMGTKNRYTKGHRKTYTNAWSYKARVKRVGKGGYRGRIGRSDFFKRAVDSRRRDAEMILEKSIIEQIKKIVRKRT